MSKKLLCLITVVIVFSVMGLGEEKGKSLRELYTPEQLEAFSAIFTPSDTEGMKKLDVSTKDIRTSFPASRSWEEYVTPMITLPENLYSAYHELMTLELFETLINIETSEVVDLSEAALFSCANGMYDSHIPRYFNFMSKYGIVLDSDYHALQKAVCTLTAPGKYFTKTWDSFELSHGETMDPEAHTNMLKSFVNNRPVMVIVWLPREFADYNSGVYAWDGVTANSGYYFYFLLVGWVDDDTVTNGGYFILRSPFGPTYGYKGYAKIAYDQPELIRFVYDISSWEKPENQAPGWNSLAKSTSGIYTYVKPGQVFQKTLEGNDRENDTLTYGFDDVQKNTNNGVDFNLNTTTGDITFNCSQDNKGYYYAYFTVSDGQHKAYQSIDLVCVNRGPVFNPDYYLFETYIDTPFRFQFSATDPDGNSSGLTYSLSSIYNRTVVPPSATIDPVTGLFEFTPSASDASVYEFYVVATDTDGSTAECDVTIEVHPYTNEHAPAFSGLQKHYVFTEGVQKRVDFSVTDEDHNYVTVSMNNAPDGLKLFTSELWGSNGYYLRWQPTYDQAGTYNMALVAKDDAFETVEWIKLTVQNKNGPPVFDDMPLTYDTREGETFTIDLNAVDPDSDNVRYYCDPLPANASLDQQTGLFSWPIGYDQSGYYTIKFVAAAGQYQDEVTVFIVVNNTKSIKK